MKAAMFASTRYLAPYGAVWPAPIASYEDETAAKSFEASMELFDLADDMGFDWVTVAEHHFSGFSMTPNPMLMAAALTQRVKKAKIALLGPNVPMLNPVRVAEEFAMLDTLTGGRVVAGMMRGTSNEYVTYNTNPAESRERLEEAVSLIKRAWTEPNPFGWQGRYFEYRSISIWPRPVQKPHPPIYVSCSSPESGEMAARNGLGAGFAVTTLPLASEASKHYREEAHKHGWEPTQDDIVYRVGIHVANTDEEAHEHLTPPANQPRGLAQTGLSTSNRSVDDAVASLGYYGRDAEHQRDRVGAARMAPLADRIELGAVIAGSPESCIKQIQRIHDQVGAGVLDLVFAGGGDAVKRSVELFGTKVLPKIRDV
jgi:alkanesulfonate monooxygenase SsuD/methylene tetrahydromethanopterin reductase-like flavin-dependent oxidoreductase (luciferase family)